MPFRPRAWLFGVYLAMGTVLPLSAQPILPDPPVPKLPDVVIPPFDPPSPQPESPKVGSPPIAPQLPLPLPPATPGAKPQTRGPVHEAFAQPTEPRTDPGAVVKQQPPEPVPELPPEERPEGNDAQWIPGYWAWDAERNGFVWVSGVYRNPPPNRTFVPGHWARVEDGWTWVPGFWAPQRQEETPYLPAPPAPLEDGPMVAGPEDGLYVPGYWSYQETRYLWRPGYWARQRPDRIWIPAQYLWTPSGYLFVDGYWDYPLENRGILFAPVVFDGPWRSDPAWCYRPSYVVSTTLVLDCLFARRSAGHFYFGNYYGPGHAALGFQPWFDRRRDPLFDYYRWARRSDPTWAASLRQTHQDRIAGKAIVPPRTLAEQTQRLTQANANFDVGKHRPIAPIGQAGATPTKLVKTNAVQTRLEAEQAERFRELAKVRASSERRERQGPAPGAPVSGGLRLGAGVPSKGAPHVVPAQTGSGAAAVPNIPRLESKRIDPPAKNETKFVEPAPKREMPRFEPPKGFDPNPRKEIPHKEKEAPRVIDTLPKREMPKREMPRLADPLPKQPPPNVGVPKTTAPPLHDSPPRPKLADPPKGNAFGGAVLPHAAGDLRGRVAASPAPVPTPAPPTVRFAPPPPPRAVAAHPAGGGVAAPPSPTPHRAVAPAPTHPPHAPAAAAHPKGKPH